MSAPCEREGTGNNADKSGQWDGGGLAVIGHLFSVVSLREKRAFKDHFIIIFLC